ncbi:MAG TPA: PhzF family phenazine biosynthesis isomerase, partial [Clostridia bacterium]|nr:PhzF family phenazine biosynthesis isomerase [Clostridia bacterium]
MVKKYRLYQIDSFTKEKFTGNPAGVITNADGLTERDMQRIARELNNSETAFVFSSDNEAYDVQIRFFTPKNEVPICGHATIAAHYARALESSFESTRVIHKTGAGILPVDIVKEPDDYKIVMTQGKVEFGAFIERKQKEILLSALGIKDEDLRTDCPIQIASTGHSKVMIGIRDRKVLNQLEPNHDMLAKLSKEIGCNGYYVFTLGALEDDVLVNGRM